MLEIKNITKDYNTGSDSVHALRGVSIAFRDSELVAILGHSGCGKTTLLNIIGGLDRYTSGDLVIDGRSTKQYKDRDWDTYRNHSIGFIFQSYNLIPHQSVLSNVELALTLSGVSKTERRRRAKEALEKVGLGDQINKRPNQMSGGQMQRVAIARALVNDPDILLADEPTGALDSETSIQIMELVKEIAKDRLVIMVTHNPDLANDYATRIVKLVDGEIKSDSDPFEPSAEKTEEVTAKKSKKAKDGKKTKMGFLTALSLSRNNLMTKKGRTFLTSFAGSIGIIGIALILSLSNGVQEYIDSVEHSTLASYPVQLDRQTINYSGMMSSMMNIADDEQLADRDPDRVYTNDMSTEMMKTMLSEIQENNLNDFMDYLETNPDNIKDCISEIKYGHKSKLYVYGRDVNDDIIRVNPSTTIQAMMGEEMAGTITGMWGTMSAFTGMDMNSRANCFEQLLSNERIAEQYETVAGHLPENYDEVVVIISERNEVSNLTLYTLGLRDQAELSEMMGHILAGESWDLETGDMSFSYDELLGLSFTALTPSDMFKKNDEGGYDDMSTDQDFMSEVLKNGTELKVVGIIRPNGDSLLSANSTGGIGYTYALTEHMITKANESELVKKQQDNPDVDIFTGIEFPKDDEEPDEPMSQEEAMQQLMGFMSQEQMGQIFQTVLQTLTQEQQMEIMQLPQEQQFAKLTELAEPNKLTGAFMSVLTAEQMQQLQQMTQKPEETKATYEGNLELLGADDLSTPDTIYIYAKDFDSKERLSDFIADYNQRMKDEGREEDAIEYTDYVGMLIEGVTDTINAISYILIAFVAISLVVSSIMIGIITYISVLERTKEIGILRAMGASKRDISNVFNAETLIVGFAAGVIGILVTVLMNFPINAIIVKLTDIENMSKLPPIAGAALVLISMLLTLIAGLFPASVAAKKDPVIALRTE
ncbi:MAG: ABC transporter ATP-binding protein/permease [Oscillospiraceae bacterium]|nr:ABC transporter ATP-binding protein/permease [Oscillospiraceae bacterium]